MDIDLASKLRVVGHMKKNKVQDKQQSQISAACQKLFDLGKITRLQNGNYTLTDKDLF
ncbi:hypothetical protein AB8878_10240 [Alphaproteobacteria bacterium LSUCC0226]